MENDFTKEELERAKEFQRYASKWVALVDEQIVAFGATLNEVSENAEKKGYKDYATFLVPPSTAIFTP